MFEHDAYRKLATLNRLIVAARDRVEQQKEPVLIQADQATCGPAVALLRELQRTVHVLIHHRGALIRRLIESPSWLEYQQGLQPRS
jgi:hypothetical protein